MKYRREFLSVFVCCCHVVSTSPRCFPGCQCFVWKLLHFINQLVNTERHPRINKEYWVWASDTEPVLLSRIYQYYMYLRSFLGKQHVAFTFLSFTILCQKHRQQEISRTPPTVLQNHMLYRKKGSTMDKVHLCTRTCERHRTEVNRGIMMQNIQSENVQIYLCPM